MTHAYKQEVAQERARQAEDDARRVHDKLSKNLAHTSLLNLQLEEAATLLETAREQVHNVYGI
jgi:hypothetical protein